MSGSSLAGAVLAWGLACGREPLPEPPAADSAAPPCATSPCAGELEAATHDGDGVWYGWEGYALAVGVIGGGAHVVVGAPRGIGPYYGQQRAQILDPVSLVSTAVLVDTGTQWSFFGGAIALHPAGDRFVVAAPNGAATNEQNGALYVYDAVPTGVVDNVQAPAAVLYGTDSRQSYLGDVVGFADAAGDGQVELLASARNPLSPLGFVYAFDAAIRGEHGVEAASRSIAAPLAVGFALWDGDGDGAPEPVVQAYPNATETVLHFPGPWTTDLTEGDADAVLTGRGATEEFGLGYPLAPVGDVDGDGLDDLAVGAPNAEGPAYRSGILFVAPAGTPLSGVADDLPIRIGGERAAEYVGASVAGGDVDGDGRPDLVVGAPGGWPEGTRGEVLVFLGPLPRGAMSSSDADAVVHGDRPWSYFGRAVAAWDADGDGRDDVYVGSPGAGERQAGRTYLFPATALLP